MLAYGLAIVIAIGSFSFYMAAFFVPEMHRRQDFIWSGLGMFYAVVLWFCAGRITGAVLLGQTASVVLLGWLGWHTLELRRDLTPETVRTPVTWDDLQRWMQQVGQKLDEYLKLGSLSTGLKTAWGEASRAIADLRHRTAGPRGVDAGVPPLQRSPAYEFETDAGAGESVPSEFATVSTRAREEAKQRDRAETAATTPEAETTEVPETSIAPQSEAPPLVEAELIEEPPEPEVQSIGQEVAEPSPTAETASTKPPQKATSPTPQTPKTQPPVEKTSPVAGAASWFGGLVRGFRKPKPQRGIVEIPPRPPSIRKSNGETEQPATAQPPKSTGKSKPQRGVIEIPPRPPSIPRSPKSDTEQKTTDQPQRGRKSKPQRGVIDIPPRPPSIPRSPKPDTEQPAAKSQPPKEPAEDANWVDVGDASASTANWPEANWPDESDTASAAASGAPATPPPASAPEPPTEANWPQEAETNWPEDDDTNWPD